MHKLAYVSGAHHALLFLGLGKYAAMLPPPSAMATAVGKRLTSAADPRLLTRGTSLVRNMDEGVDTAVNNISGALTNVRDAAGNNIETAGSRWINDEIRAQATPKLNKALMPADLAATRANSIVPTGAPPARQQPDWTRGRTTPAPPGTYLPTDAFAATIPAPK